eukprot:SAG11_NODE_29541_length_309_cov_4.176190_1_plen_57_part_10
MLSGSVTVYYKVLDQYQLHTTPNLPVPLSILLYVRNSYSCTAAKVPYRPTARTKIDP